MAEDDARAYVLAFENDKPEAARIASQTSQKLQDGQIKLVEIIKALGEYLQSTDAKIRDRATNYLAAIIVNLPSKQLSRQDISILNSFLCSRIRDGGAIEGLSRLQSLDRFSRDNATELAQAIFENFADMSDKKQAERYQVYLLLNELLGTHRKAMLEMADTSLLGYVQVFGGEKDPRNLMLIFSMLRVFMIEWDISKHIDLMFDAVYAYFPITFRPPPNDPYGITAQDLKDRLRDCLASNGELAPSTFPNLLDKLDSTSEVVKKDVLQALSACALHYDPPTIAQYSITLWDAVKFEVLQAQEPFLADEALNVIKNIAICLSRKTSPHAVEWKADPLIHYLKPINKECLEHLQEPASRQAGASGDILKAAASATTRSFEIVLKSVGPAFFTLQQASEGINNQRAILTAVNKIFEASLEVYGSWASNSNKNLEGEITLLAEFKDKLLAIYSRALMGTVKEEVSYRLAALKGLLLLAQMRNLLDDNEIGLIVQHLNDIVLDEESYGRDELKQRAMQALAEISMFRARLITDITFPKFIARLPESEKDAGTSKSYQPVLEDLAEISVGQDLLETLIRRLLNKLDILIQTGYQPTYPYTCAILSIVYYVLDRSTKNSDLGLDSYFDRVVVGLSEKAATGTSPPLCNQAVLNLLGRTINLIIRRSSDEHKDQASGNIYRLFRHSSPEMLDETNVDRYYPLSALTLSTWMLAALPKSSRTAYKVSQASDEDDPTVEQSCLRQISLLINKHLSSKEDLAQITNFFTHTIDGLKDQSTSSDSDYGNFFRSQVRYTFILTKALVLRLEASTNSILTSVVDLLQDLPPRKARYLALGFGIILAPDEILSKTNEAQIRLLAPQRVFQTLVPMFSAKFRDSDSTQEQKEIYLIALSGILGTVSSDIVMPELPTLLPLLLQSLELSDANQNVKTATLETMTVVITKNPEALIESGHIPALVRRLIAVATPSIKPAKSKLPANTGTKTSSDVIMSDAPATSSSPKVRQLALRCVALLPQHVKDQKTPSALLPLKKEVLGGLAGCLDDPRRDVRKEAVDARASWLRGVDDPEDSDED
ncbi:hypothetical protein LTS08_008346 [Lithohypha guttulata]|nr:hypothetical protein LTS08_008346 [Lithohypha guttulata]